MQYTVRCHTIMADSRLSLRHWLAVADTHQSNPDITNADLHRVLLELGHLTYKTMLRVRRAFHRQCAAYPGMSPIDALLAPVPPPTDSEVVAAIRTQPAVTQSKLSELLHLPLAAFTQNLAGLYNESAIDSVEDPHAPRAWSFIGDESNYQGSEGIPDVSHRA